MKKQSTTHILVVDDEKNILDIINEALSSDKFQITTVTDPREALEYLSSNPVDLVLTDMVMGEYSGLQILEATQLNHSDAVVILMTAHPTVEMAISVLKKGAYDFLVKPFKLDMLKQTINRALTHQQILRDNVHLRSQVNFLKVFTAHALGIEIDQVLDLVVNSCKEELGAVAVGIVEIDPKTKEPLCSACAADDKSLEEEVLDVNLLDKFAGTKKTKPVIEARRIQTGVEKNIRLSILQPVFIRRSLHGLITILIDSRFGRVTPGQLDVLTILTNSAAAAIANYNLHQDRRKSYLEAIRGLANAIEARDNYTAGHTDRVCVLAEQIALELNWDEERIAELTMGCTLHDIGKLGVPDSILNKPTSLTEDELRKMRSHPELGLKVIRGIELFKPAIPYIYSHHERWDGRGYPEGLRGEDIPVEGRLLAVADTFDAILSNRPYRKGSTLIDAVQELLKYQSVQFDPHIVDIFINVLRQGKIDLKELYNLDEDSLGLDSIVTSETVSV